MNTEDAEKALDYLKETDEPEAKLKASVEYYKEKKKMIIADMIGASSESSVSAKEHEAYRSTAYNQWLNDYKSAVVEYNIMHNRRLSAALQIEMWRSINANQRTGNI